MLFQKKMENSAVRGTGLSIEEIRSYTPEEFRRYLERNKCKKLEIVSEFPAIGRGNVLRDNLKSSSDINSEIDRILR